MQSTIMRIEIIFASVLPVSAVLAVGMIGIEQMIHVDVRIFLISILVCAFIVFFGEIIVLQVLQRTTRIQFTELIDTCHDYIAGNRERRAVLSGDNALITLATTINNLLDTTSRVEQTPRQVSSSEDTGNALLSRQVQKLLHDIKPVTEGDLRVDIEVPEGNIGIIANICCALIEELADQVRWTRYSSEQVIGAAATILGGTIELAQTVEMQMLRFSETTEVVEKLVAFIQRLSNTLQVSVEMSQDLRGHLQQQIDLVEQAEEATSSKDTRLSEFTHQSELLAVQLNGDIERQVQLLEEVSRSTQSHTALGEAMITDFYTFAQRIHQSSTEILQTAEHINEMAQLARRWQEAVMVFQLREEESQELT